MLYCPWFRFITIIKNTAAEIFPLHQRWGWFHWWGYKIGECTRTDWEMTEVDWGIRLFSFRGLSLCPWPVLSHGHSLHSSDPHLSRCFMHIFWLLSPSLQGTATHIRASGGSHHLLLQSICLYLIHSHTTWHRIDLWINVSRGRSWACIKNLSKSETKGYNPTLLITWIQPDPCAVYCPISLSIVCLSRALQLIALLIHWTWGQTQIIIRNKYLVYFT